MLLIDIMNFIINITNTQYWKDNEHTQATARQNATEASWYNSFVCTFNER